MLSCKPCQQPPRPPVPLPLPLHFDIISTSLFAFSSGEVLSLTQPVPNWECNSAGSGRIAHGLIIHDDPGSVAIIIAQDCAIVKFLGEMLGAGEHADVYELQIVHIPYEIVSQNLRHIALVLQKKYNRYW